MSVSKSKILILSTITIISFSLIAIPIVLSNKNDPQKEIDLPSYIISFDSQGGTELPRLTVKEGEKIPKPLDPVKNGFSINGWFLGEKEWNFDSDMVYSNLTLKASWRYDEYSILYIFNGGETEEKYKTSYNIDSSFSLIKPTKKSEVFGGWFDQIGRRIEKIEKGMSGNLILTAKWIDNLVTKSFDETKGTIKVYCEKATSNVVTVENVPINNKYHVFNGWYDENNKLLSTEQTYTFVLKENIVNYVNAFYMDDSQENEWNQTHGATPILDLKNNRINYGIYPQSNVNDETLIAKLDKLNPSSFNNYYYYNQEYYAKKEASLAKDFKTGEPLAIHDFDNGKTINENDSYWFKVEPISWKILKHEGDNYFLLSEKLIEVRRYSTSPIREIDGKTIMPNNYKHSGVRSWLNKDFYNNAFCFGGLNIKTMEVDNSASSTATPDSGFECENTNDNVTLLSYKDYTNPEYGFSGPGSSPSARRFLTTDYARASKANYSTDEAYPYSGYCWTRSPIKTSENNGYCVSRNNKIGVLNNDYVGFSESCVQPAITIVFDI